MSDFWLIWCIALGIWYLSILAYVVHTRKHLKLVSNDQFLKEINEKKWCLYVLQCNDGTYYTGITTDVVRRLNEHNTSSKGAKYTKPRRPARLVYWVDYEDRSTAQKAEYKFKQLTRKQKEKIIHEVS
jgi:putative endonuclease